MMEPGTIVTGSHGVCQRAVIEMSPDKECKGSVRYATDDEDAPVRNIYLSRSFAKPMPEKITVTIQA